MKLKVSDYARLEGITTAGVYKRHKDGKITIEESYGLKLVVLTSEDYEAKKLDYRSRNKHEFTTLINLREINKHQFKI